MRFPALFTGLLLLLIPSLTWSQEAGKEVFLLVDNTPVFAEEFIYMYERNSGVLAKEQSEDLEDFLELFIAYKLKLAEARSLKLDENKAYLKDITDYKADIALQYLDKDALTQNILEEMYQRSLKELRASHILINLPAYAYGKDTLKAYERIHALRERALAGEDFSQLAQSYSEEPSAKNTKGDLGYFSTMQMVMPFEDAAYSTPIGGISPILRTGYGYHVLKVQEERVKEPKLKVAHILVVHSKDSLADKNRIQEAYAEVEKGKDFGEVAEKYSQDAATRNNAGELEPFGRRDVRLEGFADIAYHLEEGAHSPIFKTNLGWHIIKLKERLPQPSKEEVYKEIQSFFNETGGSVYYDQKKDKQLAEILNYRNLNEDYTQDILRSIDREYLLKVKDPIYLSKEANKELFQLWEHTFYYNDLLKFLASATPYATEGMRTEQVLHNAFENFKKEKFLEVYSEKLSKENKEFAKQIDTYNKGILLFDLMQQEVWQKTRQNKVAQKEYYEKHKRDFDVAAHIEVLSYKTNNEEVAEAIKEMLKNGVEKEVLNREFALHPVLETWFKDNQHLKSKHFPPKNTLQIIKEGEEYQVIEVQDYVERKERDFERVKNEVVQAYVKDFESKWLQSLRKKYKVKLKRKKWKKLKSELL